MIRIFGTDVEQNEANIHIPYLLRYVSSEKQYRINALRNLKDAECKLVGDLLIRAIACRYLNVKNGELIFCVNKYGKPYILGINDFYFNLSHSGKWIVCTIDQEPVGVDVEEIAPIEIDIAHKYFSQEEIDYINAKPENERVSAFYDIWTYKESYIKALGYGLSKDLNTFTIKTIDEDAAFVFDSIGNKRVYLRQYKVDKEYRLSVCSLRNDFPQDIQIVDMDWILEGII